MAHKLFWKISLAIITTITIFGLIAWTFYLPNNLSNPFLLSQKFINSDSNLIWTAPDIDGGDHKPRTGYPQYIGKFESLVASEVQAQAVNPSYNCPFPNPPTIQANTFGDLISEQLANVAVTECPNKVIGVQMWSSWAGRPDHSENFDQQKLSYTVRITKISTGVMVINETEEIMNTPAVNGVLAAYYYYQMPPGDSYRVAVSVSMRQNGCNNGQGQSTAEATYTGQGITPSPTPVPTVTPIPTPTTRPTATPTIRPTPTPTTRPTPTPTCPPGQVRDIHGVCGNPTADPESPEPPTVTPTP